MPDDPVRNRTHTTTDSRIRSQQDYRIRHRESINRKARERKALAKGKTLGPDVPLKKMRKTLPFNPRPVGMVLDAVFDPFKVYEPGDPQSRTPSWCVVTHMTEVIASWSREEFSHERAA